TSLVDNCLTEDALELEAEPLSRLARGRIETVTLPFVATIPKLVENVSHEEELSFGGHWPLLEQRRKHYRPHLNYALLRMDQHQGESVECLARLAINDRVVKGVGAACCSVDIETVVFGVVEWPDWHIGPVPMIRRSTVCRI